MTARYRVRVALVGPAGAPVAPGAVLTLTPRQAQYWLAAGKIEPYREAPRPMKRKPKQRSVPHA